MKKHIYVAGAQSRARTLDEYFSVINPDYFIEAFLVSEPKENPKFIKGIPIKKISNETELDLSLPVYIATRGCFHVELTEALVALGFKEIYPITVALDMQYRNEYVKQHLLAKGLSFPKIYDFPAEPVCSGDKTGTIYIASTVFDATLKDVHKIKPFERVVQAGTALTEKRLDGALFDNEGENISEKNRQFCELTVMYWLWKHATDDYIGLAHYRRHFILPDDWKERMEANNIDAILPVPACVAPNIETDYKLRHVSEDWDYMLYLLRSTNYEDYEWAMKVFSDKLYYSCNMFILRREVFLDFCEWLFPILDEVVKYGRTREDSYLNRYPGFISERLLTLFFEKNRDKYNIVYTDKNFLF